MELGPIEVNAATTAADLLRPFDNNGDGQLSADEFENLLRRLISALGRPGAVTTDRPLAAQAVKDPVDSATTSAPATPTTTKTPATSTTATAAPAALKSYVAMAGWDGERMNNASDLEAKYVFGRLVEELGNPAPTTANLEKLIIPGLRAHGFNATLVGKDVIDFGDQWPQDVIRDVDGPLASWQFINAGGSAPAPTVDTQTSGAAAVAAANGGPVGSILQYDPGVFKDEVGQYFIGIANGGYKKVDLASLDIGGWMRG